MNSTQPAVEAFNLLNLADPAAYIYWAVVFFFIGLFLGSFFNVCIYRIPAGLSVNNPKRSFCYRCGSMVRWYDNIPVISYLLLGGRCRDCGTGFSPRYMLVELLTGGMFLAMFLAANPWGESTFQFATLWYCAFAGLLIVGSFTDLDAWIIPDGITLGGAVAALVVAIPIGILDQAPLLARLGPFPTVRLNWGDDPILLIGNLLSPHGGIGADWMMWWEPFVNSVLGAIFGPALLYGVAVLGRVLFRKEAMGMGDVKLFVLIGATVGITGSILVLFLASFIGTGMALLGFLIGRMGKNSPPILQEGPARLASLEGETPEGDATVQRLTEIGAVLPTPRQVHHLPFGPSIALGALVIVLLQNVLF